MPINNGVTNQKGTPAFYTDTFANRPAFGYAGRVFISTDSGQIFEDTGTAWTLIADAGVGGGTLSSVCLNGNTTASGIVITAGGLTANSISKSGGTASEFLKANGTVDSTTYVDISSTQTISGTKTFSATATNIYKVRIDNTVDATTIAFKQYASGSLGESGNTSLSAIGANEFNINWGGTKTATFDSTSLSGQKIYTLPNATGTLALTSDLSSYVPYTGATANLDLGTFDFTTDIATLNQVKAVGSGGISFNANGGTQIALMGAGGGANMTLYGGLTGTSATFSGTINLTGAANTFQIAAINRNANRIFFCGDTGGFFFVNSGNTATTLFMGDNGNVLIGTTTDSGGKLQVVGEIRVNTNTRLYSQNQNVSTSSTQVSAGSIGVGALYFCSWFNTSGGAQGIATVMTRASTVVIIAISDG
jgi:hypothetical protein